ncbi:MAG TPA: phosphatidylserine/phosphatidylglycerophosphate/cardiolipin synthase family protein [Pirellulales bacterium]|nr:phosphatidylserine/phosphatidylglycerophosphate/cardiolipin synthase family protein [Pirellulales bacterium]
MSQLESHESSAPPSAHRAGEVGALRVAGHDVTIFEESPPLIAAMIEDIERARHRVWLESYIIANDTAGRALGEALIRRAAAGADCRVIYDYVGSASTPASFFAWLARSGVQVRGYRSLWQAIWRLRSLRWFHRRDHRKLLVIDDRVAYFGGMNIVDQSGIHTVEEARVRHLPASAGWRDVHLRLEGPRQWEVADAFARLWRRPRLARLVRRRRRWPRWQIRRMFAERGEGIYFFDCRPQLRHRRPTRVLVPLLRQAKRTITVSMAYFIPQGAVLRELLRARRRGVKVRVILPGKSDVRTVRWASRHLYDKLLRRGIRIYERKDLMLHSKVMVIDDEWSLIGSCNLDPRSLWHNLEFFAVFRSRTMAADIRRICRFEMRNSRSVTLLDSLGRPWWQRLLDRCAWSLRHLL